MIRFELPAKLDLSSVTATAARIEELHGTPLQLDAGNVAHLGGLGLQLLIAVTRDWAGSGIDLTIGPKSEAFSNQLAAFGIDAGLLQNGAC